MTQLMADKMLQMNDVPAVHSDDLQRDDVPEATPLLENPVILC